MTDWQSIAALALVGLSAGFVAYRTWRLLSTGRSSGCGRCQGCPSVDSTKTVAKPLVSIETRRPGR